MPSIFSGRKSGGASTTISSSSSRRGRRNTNDSNTDGSTAAAAQAARSRSPPITQQQQEQQQQQILPSQIGSFGSNASSLTSRTTRNSTSTRSSRTSTRSKNTKRATSPIVSVTSNSNAVSTSVTKRTTKGNHGAPAENNNNNHNTSSTEEVVIEEEFEIGYGCNADMDAYGCYSIPSASQKGFLAFLAKQRQAVQSNLKSAATSSTAPSANASAAAAAEQQRQINNNSAWDHYYTNRNNSTLSTTTGGGNDNNNTTTTPYQSYRDASSRIYRGFSTPIAAGMFQHVENERLDCCSIACCGVLQSDRNRFLVKGIQPPTCFRRFWLHIVLPLALFIFAGYCAFHIHSIYYNQLIVTGIITMLLSYMIVQCCKGRWKRISVRRELLWRLHHMDRGYDNDDIAQSSFEEAEEEASINSDLQPAYLNGQSTNDLWYAHHFCLGCYNTDIPRNTDLEQELSKSNNLCGSLWQLCSKYLLCGCCGMHLQLCGMCGTAQEARELEVLLPASKRRMDYVSMQPMIEYYPKILQLRTSLNDNLWDHYHALSQLSKSLLTYLGIALGVLLLLSLIPSKNAAQYHHAHQFEWKHFLMLLATFMQSFVLLYFVHWHWEHKFDLSLDAVIKYFASGFLLSTTLAIFFEFLVGIVLKITMFLIMALFDIDIQTDEDGYSSSTSSSTENGLYQLVVSPLGGFGHAPVAASAGKKYLEAFGKEHPIIFIMYICITCYVLAALVEELCKYFGYRMVDHPDFHSQRELEEAAAERTSGAIPDVAGDAMEVADDASALDEIENQRMDFTGQERSATSLGSSITTAMVATAIGFACCENLVYVFVYHSHSGFGLQMTVLIVRSLFPIHPIAAAIQSIGVVKRDIENMNRFQLGRIVRPAVLLHGSFDFILVLADFLSGLSPNNADAAQSANEWYGFASLVMSFICMVLGILYYWKEAKAQKSRLLALDYGTATSALTHSPNTRDEGREAIIQDDGQYRNVV